MRARAALMLGLVLGTTGAAPSALAALLHSEQSTTRVAGTVNALRVRGDVSNVVLLPGRATSVTAHLEWTLSRPDVTVSLSHGVLTVRATCNDGVGGAVVRVGLVGTCVDDLSVVLPAASDVVVSTGGSVTASRFAGPLDLTGENVDVADARVPQLHVSASYDATVRRVDATAVDLSAVSGTLTADRVTGRSVSLSTGNGGLRATAIQAASVSASSSSGDVGLSGSRGQVVDVSSGNGAVNVQDVAAATLTAKASSGDVSLARVAARRLEATSGNGRVSLDDVAADRASARSSSGDVAVQRLTGRQLEAGSGNGALSLSDLHLTDIVAKSSSGDVSLETSDIPDRVTAGSGNGLVTLRVPKAAYYIVASSGNGTVSIDGLTSDRFARREITATSSSGDVHISGT